MRAFRSASLVLVALLAACETPSPTAAPDALLGTTTGAVLVECPTSESRSASATVNGLGGTVTLGNHRIEIPVGAVLGPTKITVAEPVSNYMELSIRAGNDEHFQFQKPVRITISYERCTRSNIEKASLEVWHIDEVTKALLQNMGGTDDKLARTVTFGTDHLSGYVIAD